MLEHPLEAILNPNILQEGHGADSRSLLAQKGSEDWPYEDEFHVCEPLS